MTIPDFQSIMLPLLTLASDSEVHDFHTATNELAQEFNLTEEDLSTLILSGQPKFNNRVGWAKTFLKQAGLIIYPTRGHLQITPLGIQVVEDKLEKINIAFLRKYPEFVEFQRRTNVHEIEENHNEEQDELTPEEAIESAYQKIQSDLNDELLGYVLKSPPVFFEKLVVELLVAMGYGGTQREAARAVGRAGDEGIDGIIDEDRLGLDNIYIQAKRWQLDSKIGRPQIQTFVGALQGRRAKKGIFITTASFTSEAYDYAKGIETKVVLIDGEKLANLMIDFGIGVTTRTKYEIKELDSDYFGEVAEN